MKGTSQLRIRNSTFKQSQVDLEEEGLVDHEAQDRPSKYSQIEMTENKSKNLENIKQVLGEINQIFTKFSEIVNAQQLMVERIDTDTEIALLNVEQGKKVNYLNFQN